MSFRRAFCALAVLMGLAPTAWAQEARQVEIGYEITFAGFTGFRIDITGRLDGATYDVESHVFKQGILRAITLHYDGRNRAWGNAGPQGVQPAGGSLSIIVSNQPRTWLAVYGPGGSLQETHNP